MIVSRLFWDTPTHFHLLAFGLGGSTAVCVLLHTHTHAQTHHLSWRVHGDRCLQVAVYLLVANLSYGEGFSQPLCTHTHTVTHACMHACKHGGVREKHTFEQQSEKKNKTLNPIKWELLAAVVGI